MLKYLLIILFPFSIFCQNVWEMTEYRAGGVYGTLECVDSNNCFATTRNGRIFYSSNQGKSWKILLNEKVITKSRGWLENAEFVDTNTFFLDYWDGVLLITKDGGRTFDSLDMRKDLEIYWLKMFNENEGLANVYLTYDENPRLVFFYTKDSWKSWDTIESWHTIDNWNSNKNEEIWGVGKAQINNNGEIISMLTGYSDITKKATMYYGLYDTSKSTFDIIYEHKHNRRVGNNLTINDDYYFSIGTAGGTNSGRSRDFIYKFDSKNNYGRPVIDLFYTPNAWGFQDIAFKNDSVGIAVGQFGKISYTYDYGESWYYETVPNKFISENEPATMLVTFAGGRAIIAGHDNYLFRMTEDNLAPKPQDTLIISGYVKEGNKPQAEIPVALNNRYTMTDSNGYYQFIQIRPGKEYKLNVYNKYYSYTPYSYNPDYIKITTYKDTLINFLATDKRIFHHISGNVSKELVGLSNIPIQSIKEVNYYDREYDTVYTNNDGFFIFENIEDGFVYRYMPLSEMYEFEPTEYRFATNGDRAGYKFKATLTTSVPDDPNFEIRANILYSKDISGKHFKIISMTGAIIDEGALSKELNLNPYPSGTYILQITNGNEIIFTYKFQVVR